MENLMKDILIQKVWKETSNHLAEKGYTLDCWHLDEEDETFEMVQGKLYIRFVLHSTLTKRFWETRTSILVTTVTDNIGTTKITIENL